MRRIWVVILALLIMLLVTACGGDVPTVEVPQEHQEVQEAEKPEEVKEQTEFEEVTVIDNEDCVIRITGVDPDDFWGYTLNAYMENKSTDKLYTFSVESAAINGVVCDPYFATEIAAGKKENVDISFSDSSLVENGIVDFTDIEMTFRVYVSDDWSAEDVVRTTAHIFPYGEDNATQYVRESVDTDRVVMNNDYVTVTVTGYEMDDLWGYTVNLFLVNKTDTEVMFSADNVSVNGYMADPYYAASVPAGKCAFSSMSWSTSIFEENGISEVEEIELQFRAYNDEDWMADDFANETITLNP